MQILLMKFYGSHQFSESFDHLYLEQESESHPNNGGTRGFISECL